jgi:hypothetical protein
MRNLVVMDPPSSSMTFKREAKNDNSPSCASCMTRSSLMDVSIGFRFFRGWWWLSHASVGALSTKSFSSSSPDNSPLAVADVTSLGCGAAGDGDDKFSRSDCRQLIKYSTPLPRCRFNKALVLF